MLYLAGPRGYFPKLSKGSETLVMTSEGLGEMFESEFTDTCTNKIPLVLMGGGAEGQACADLGARTPIGASGICHKVVESNPPYGRVVETIPVKKNNFL